MVRKMSNVDKCDVNACAYNHEGMCHTIAITVGGDAAHPKCDTYFGGQAKGGDRAVVAGVGACKVGSCEYNTDFECTASKISVGHGADEADCMTFEQK